MEINRDVYLNRLIVRKHNGFIKVITGIRRCGKSYLLNTLFLFCTLFVDCLINTTSLSGNSDSI